MTHVVFLLHMVWALLNIQSVQYGLMYLILGYFGFCQTIGYYFSQEIYYVLKALGYERNESYCSKNKNQKYFLLVFFGLL